MLGIFARTFRVATLSDFPVACDVAQRAAADAKRATQALNAVPETRPRDLTA